MKKTLLLFGFILYTTLSIAQERSFDEKIGYMLELSGAKNAMEMVINNSLERQKANYGGKYSAGFWDTLQMEMQLKFFDDLLIKMVPIYKKHLSEEDIDGIIAFYESEAGQHFIAQSPAILDAAMDIGADWGKEIATLVQEKIQNSLKTRFNTNYEGCGNFHDGVYRYDFQDDSLMVDVIRKGNFQTEVFQGKTYYFYIEWLDDCRFAMYKCDENGKRLDEEDIVVIVNIVSIEGNRCVYIANTPGSEKYDENELFKVE